MQCIATLVETPYILFLSQLTLTRNFDYMGLAYTGQLAMSQLTGPIWVVGRYLTTLLHKTKLFQQKIPFCLFTFELYISWASGQKSNNIVSQNKVVLAKNSLLHLIPGFMHFMLDLCPKKWD